MCFWLCKLWDFSQPLTFNLVISVLLISDGLMFSSVNKYHLSIKHSQMLDWLEIFSFIFSRLLPFNTETKMCWLKTPQLWTDDVRFFKPFPPYIKKKNPSKWQNVTTVKIFFRVNVPGINVHISFLSIQPRFFFSCTNVGQETFHVQLVDSGCIVPSSPLPPFQTI